MMNILITGSKGSGKSYLISKILEITQFTSTGFITVACTDGFKMVNLESTYSKRISLCKNHVNVGIESSFETFGVSCLKATLLSNSDIIIMDELGRFERHCHLFIEMVNKILDSKRWTLIVIKKEDIEYLEKIKQRNDVILFDLDMQDRNSVRSKILEMLEGKKC